MGALPERSRELCGRRLFAEAFKVAHAGHRANQLGRTRSPGFESSKPLSAKRGQSTSHRRLRRACAVAADRWNMIQQPLPFAPRCAGPPWCTPFHCDACARPFKASQALLSHTRSPDHIEQQRAVRLIQGFDPAALTTPAKPTMTSVSFAPLELVEILPSMAANVVYLGSPPASPPKRKLPAGKLARGARVRIEVEELRKQKGPRIYDRTSKKHSVPLGNHSQG